MVEGATGREYIQEGASTKLNIPTYATPSASVERPDNGYGRAVSINNVNLSEGPGHNYDELDGEVSTEDAVGHFFSD